MIEEDDDTIGELLLEARMVAAVTVLKRSDL